MAKAVAGLTVFKQKSIMPLPSVPFFVEIVYSPATKFPENCSVIESVSNSPEHLYPEADTIVIGVGPATTKSLPLEAIEEHCIGLLIFKPICGLLQTTVAF